MQNGPEDGLWWWPRKRGSVHSKNFKVMLSIFCWNSTLNKVTTAEYLEAKWHVHSKIDHASFNRSIGLVDVRLGQRNMDVKRSGR